MNYDYDLFVIGAGSGGVRAARMAASYGAKVAIAEEYRVGGTCVIRGCIPKKLFVYASQFAEEFEDAAGFGWGLGERHFDWKKLVAQKDREIERLNKIYIRNLEASGVRIYPARATIEDAHHIRVDGEKISAAYILIAVGGTPFKPAIAGSDYAITSNEAFHLETLPEHITIIGGGYIAVEFAGIFNGLGVSTRLIYRGEKILRGFDDDLRDHLTEALQQKGIELLTNTDVAAIEADETGYHLTYTDGQKAHSGLVMYATGRVPNVSGLGVDKAGVACKETGEVIVDAYSKTSQESVYAVGDVTGRVALTPIAIREGAACAATLFNNDPQKVDYSLVPKAVFSQPEIATIGMSEAEARAAYGEKVDIYKTRFRPLKHTLSGNADTMLMKLVVHRSSQKVLGVHIIGAAAAEMCQAFAVALTMGATKAQFDATIALHPTAAEEMVTFT